MYTRTHTYVYTRTHSGSRSRGRAGRGCNWCPPRLHTRPCGFSPRSWQRPQAEVAPGAGQCHSAAPRTWPGSAAAGRRGAPRRCRQQAGGRGEKRERRSPRQRPRSRLPGCALGVSSGSLRLGAYKGPVERAGPGDVALAPLGPPSPTPPGTCARARHQPPSPLGLPLLVGWAGLGGGRHPWAPGPSPPRSTSPALPCSGAATGLSLLPPAPAVLGLLPVSWGLRRLLYRLPPLPCFTFSLMNFILFSFLFIHMIFHIRFLFTHALFRVSFYSCSRPLCSHLDVFALFGFIHIFFWLWFIQLAATYIHFAHKPIRAGSGLFRSICIFVNGRTNPSCLGFTGESVTKSFTL